MRDPFFERKERRDIEDYLTLNGATKLARKLTAHWATQGLDVRCRIEVANIQDVEKMPTNNLFVVRSDMIDGHPTRRRLAWAE